MFNCLIQSLFCMIFVFHLIFFLFRALPAVCMLSVKSGLRLNQFFPRFNWWSTFYLGWICTLPSLKLLSTPTRPPKRIENTLPSLKSQHVSSYRFLCSTLQDNKGTKNCALHLPVLKLGPSRYIILCLHHLWLQERTWSTQHSSFHYLLFYNK